MALMAIVMAFSAPMLSRSMRERHLVDEAGRFLALTEYARQEAISQGVPMVIWADSETGHYGLKPQAGFANAEVRLREFALDPDVSLKVADTDSSGGAVDIMEFSPEGVSEISSAASVLFSDRFEAALSVERNAAGIGYKLAREAK
jgi:Tfp pilus assembly protein FimT